MTDPNLPPLRPAPNDIGEVGAFLPGTRSPVIKTRDLVIALKLAELREMGVYVQAATPEAPEEPLPPDAPEIPPEVPPEVDPPPPPRLMPFSEEAIKLAQAGGLIRFDEDAPGGSHTVNFRSGEFVLAANSYAGDQRTDAKLLEQLVNVIRNGNEPTSTGVGYIDLAQLATLCMFLLVRKMPRLWDELEQGQREMVRKIVWGATISSAFVSSDHNPYVVAKTKEKGINGVGTSRTFNANFRLGMVGPYVIGKLFEQADGQANPFLAGDFSHAKWIEFLGQAPISANLTKTYTRHTAAGPTVAEFEGCLRKPFSYWGAKTPMEIVTQALSQAAGGTIFEGLEAGAGKVGTNAKVGGTFGKGPQSGIPHLGEPGMFDEFKTVDGGGPRSSAHYCSHNLTGCAVLSYALAARGHWMPKDHPALLDLLVVAAGDFGYRVSDGVGGWRDFMHGKGYDPSFLNDGKGNRLMLATVGVLEQFLGGGA